MDEEQHYESFHMDKDFEGLVEVGGEFMFRSRKKKRVQSREEQLYGYQSSDSEGDDDGFGGGRRGKRGKKADYSKPVGFVSSGVMVQNQDGTTQEQDKQQQQQQQQQQQPSAPAEAAADAEADADAAGGGGGRGGLGFGGAGAGLGFGGGGAGLGFSSGAPGLGSSTGGGLGFTAGGGSGGGGLGFKSGGVQQQGAAAAAGRGSNGLLRHHQQQQQQEEGEDDEAEVLPTAFGKRIKAAVEQKQKQKQAATQAAAQRTAARTANPDLGSFEAHTKGIGAKLLQKMNWTPGQGLGRNRQGIAKPLEAKLRPKGMGMGFGDYQETKQEVKPSPAQKAAADADAAELEGELAAAAAKTQAPLWKKKAAPVRQKRIYKTAEEVLEESTGGGGAKVATQPILDLRGPQARLVTDLEQLNATEDGAPADAGPPMPELHHNMGLLVSMTEAQLRRMDAQLQHQQDTATLLAQEKARLAKEVAAAAAAADRLAGLTTRLAKIQGQAANGSLSLQQLLGAYTDMATSYPEEYVIYSLAAAALAQVLPRFRSLLAGWQPLLEPQRGVPELKAWRGLLEGEGTRQSVLLGGAGWEDAGDPYATLVAEVVMSPIRSAITQWEPRHPEPLLAWFDAWAPLLPRGACQTLLQGLVMPRIAAAVEGWDPTRETQPIHAWLHPWLPYLAPEMVSVYPTIRHRLSRALTAWHASDGSARILLGPWVKVFELQDWEGLMARCILPKLAQAMQTEMVLNPLQPQLEPFDWALSWHGLVPLHQLAGLMEASFFPPWLALLHHWLSHSPDYDEVTRWYLEWKGRFPQDLLDHPRVRAGFSQALNMMNSAADGQPLPYPAAAAVAAGGAAAAGSIPSWRMEVEPDSAAAAAGQFTGARPGPGPAVGQAGPEPSFRDLVGQYAQEQGLEFLPRAGRLHDGLPVYSFGGVSCVVDASRGVVRAQLKGRGWVPVSLEGLKAEALSKGGGK